MMAALPNVTAYRRQGRRWVRYDVGDLSASVELTSINSQLSLADVYAGVTFD
ncbi:MAG: hypothetical protein ACJ74J_04345 [Blastocatellia bacterium]